MSTTKSMLFCTLTLSFTLFTAVQAHAVEAEVEAVDQALENVESQTAEVVEETVTEAVAEAVEAAPVEPAAPAADKNAPTVYVVPLGGEMNLKVIYDHPMDHEGGNYIESVLMEAPNGDFLGLKTFNSRHKEPLAEFLVNTKLVDFDVVTFIAKSTTLGEIRSTQKLELTPEDQLPDEYNPKKMRERLAKMRQEAIAKAKKAKEKPAKKVVEKPKKVEKKVVESATEAVEEETSEEPKKKRFGLF